MPYKLTAAKRSERGEKTRTKQVIPAVVYGGSGLGNMSLSLNYKDFAKLFDEAGESSLIDLTIDNKDVGKVLIHDVQYDPVSDKVIHVDLRRIDMDKPMKVTVGLNFIGESPVVKELGGTVVRVLEEVEVKCLPKDLVSKIIVDLSALKTFADLIRVKDIQVPVGMTITFPSVEDVIAKAQAAMTEEEIKAMEAGAQTDVSKIEMAGKKKEDETVEAEQGLAQNKDEGKKEEKKEEKK